MVSDLRQFEVYLGGKKLCTDKNSANIWVVHTSFLAVEGSEPFKGFSWLIFKLKLLVTSIPQFLFIYTKCHDTRSYLINDVFQSHTCPRYMEDVSKMSNEKKGGLSPRKASSLLIVLKD